MRGWRAPLLLTIFSLLGLAVFLLANSSTGIITGGYYGGGSGVRPFPLATTVGSNLYLAFSFLQFGLIALTMPAMGAGSIAGEREKQTLDLLLSSRMSVTGIIFGKIGANMTYMLFLLFASLPLFSTVFLLGAYTIGQVLGVFLLLIVAGYLFISVSTFFSVVCKRTAFATITSYVVLLIFGIGTILLGVYFANRFSTDQYMPAQTTAFFPLLWRINPLMTLNSFISSGMQNYGGYNPFFGGMSLPPIDLTDLLKNTLINSGLVVGISLIFNIASILFLKPVKKFSWK